MLFTARGRINRRTYWIASIFTWSTFYVLFNLIDLVSYTATLIIYPLLFWALISTAIKRIHDTGRSGVWLWIVLIPVVGPLILIFFLGFRKGNRTKNRFGAAPGSAPDYYKNDNGRSVKDEERIIDDVTQINPLLLRRL
ncbi:MAG: DUF805 domain-containing protein [Bacteroidota bacterium]